MSSLVLSEIFPPRVGGSGHWLHEIYSRQAPERTVLLVGEHEDAHDFDRRSTLRIIRADLSAPTWTLMTRTGREYFRSMFREVKRLMRSHDADQIHCARVMPEGIIGYFASLRLGVKLVCFVHGEDIELARRGRESLWLVNRVIARSDRLICNSLNTRRMLREDWGCDERKIVVLNPGIDVDRFHPPADIDAAKETFGWTGRKVLLTVSRLEIRKGHDVMISALPQLLKRVPDLLYIIVGEGGERDALERRVDELGVRSHVVFLGGCDVDTLLASLQASDVFVLPNRQVGSSVEGFGIVLLEAQACATPVIAGNSGGTAETMIVGETGLIVDCTRPENLVEPVASLLKDEHRRKVMGNAGRRFMQKRFDWKNLATQASEKVFID